MSITVTSKFRYGLTLRNRRNRLRYTADEIARIAGISLKSIQRIEQGKTVGYWLIRKYVIALGGTLEINFPPIPGYKEQKKIDKKKGENNSNFDYNL